MRLSVQRRKVRPRDGKTPPLLIRVEMTWDDGEMLHGSRSAAEAKDQWIFVKKQAKGVRPLASADAFPDFALIIELPTDSERARLLAGHEVNRVGWERLVGAWPEKGGIRERGSLWCEFAIVAHRLRFDPALRSIVNDDRGVTEQFAPARASIISHGKAVIWMAAEMIRRALLPSDEPIDYNLMESTATARLVAAVPSLADDDVFIYEDHVTIAEAFITTTAFGRNLRYTNRTNMGERAGWRRRNIQGGVLDYVVSYEEVRNAVADFLRKQRFRRANTRSRATVAVTIGFIRQITEAAEVACGLRDKRAAEKRSTSLRSV